MVSNIVRFSLMTEVPIASITASYTAFGVPFAHPMRVLHLINDSNGTYYFSFDTINDNFVLLANSFVLYDLTSDQDHNESFRYQKGSQLYIKSVVTPTTQTLSSNSVYGVTIYGQGE
jgi:hypothetical protein